MKISTATLIVLFLLCNPSDWSAYGQTAGNRGAASSDEAQLERLFLDAELLLDSERKPKQAAKLFRKVWKDRDAPRILKAEALAGLIRCERLLGNDKKANSLLRELIDDFGDLPAVSQEILRLSAGGSGTSFLAGIEVVPEGRFLDLDTGGVITAIRSGSGSAPELVVRNNEVVFLTSLREDKAMASLAQKIYDAPWHRVHTDLGRNAWVQIIGARDPLTVRFYTALSGTQSLLPAPRNLFCAGKPKQIDVHFEASDMFSSYRVERQDAVTQPFQLLKTVRKGPFTDDNVVPGSRYVYKITGIGRNKAESLPATVDGTTNSHGVFSGTVVLDWGHGGGRSFDFLTGKHVERGGDITLTGTYGSWSPGSFTGGFGVHAIPLPGDPDAPYYASGKQIPAHIPFHVFLRGGGVAKCIWKPVERTEVLVEYMVNPDAADLDLRPIVTVETEAGMAVITVAAPDDYSAESVTATDAASGEERILAVKNGEARDRQIEKRCFLTYSATCVDRFGRRTAPGTATVNLSPEGVRTGEFRFHYHQTYSIELDKIMPFDGADVFFVSCAGGISTVVLQAPGGISNLEWGDVRESAIYGCTADDLFEAIVAVDPDAVPLGGRADGDSREPSHDVFVLETRFGGWAKLAIVDRSDEGPWKEMPVTIRYAYNPHEPIFTDGDAADTITVHGVTFNVDTLNKSREKVALRQHQLLADIDKKASNLAGSLAEKVGKEVQVVALLGRSFANSLNLPDDYRVSTFSFHYATRDDTKLVHNNWDIAFGNGDSEIYVWSPSSIWDLGEVEFDEVDISEGHPYEKVEKVLVAKDHLYVMHVHDRNTDLWVKMQILDQNSGEWIVFRWEIIDDVEKVIRLERLPALEMKTPVVNIQIRAGAGGGNPNRVSMDGSTSVYVDEVSNLPLDMSTPPKMRERSRCYFEGGFIPEGKVWVVKFIEFAARTDGDTNGWGEFLLYVGPFTIAHFPKDYHSENAIYTIDGGVRVLEAGESTVKHSLAMNIPLWPGDEKDVVAEVANSSLCDVVIRGDFVDAKDYRGKRDRGVPALSNLPRYFFKVRELEKTHAHAALEQDARKNRDLLPYLEKILEAATSDEYRALLEKMIEAAEQ